MCSAADDCGGGEPPPSVFSVLPLPAAVCSSTTSDAASGNSVAFEVATTLPFGPSTSITRAGCPYSIRAVSRRKFPSTLSSPRLRPSSHSFSFACAHSSTPRNRPFTSDCPRQRFQRTAGPWSFALSKWTLFHCLLRSLRCSASATAQPGGLGLLLPASLPTVFPGRLVNGSATTMCALPLAIV